MALKIKICGTTNATDAQLAVDSGADLLGFIFYAKSPRYITPAAAGDIITGLPPAIGKIGVFVNESVETMLSIAEEAGLTGLQLHGEESPELIPRLAGYDIVKAISLRTAGDLARLDDFAGVGILIDTPCPQWGGSGATGNWDLARAAAERRDILLAGGLTPDNVAAAITAVRPAGVDAVSGVEAEKGVKAPDKVRQFIAAARAAAGEDQ